MASGGGFWHRCRVVTIQVCLHLALFLIVVGYCIIGSMIFQALDHAHKKPQFVNIVAARKTTVDNFFTVAVTLSRQPEEYKVLATNLLLEYEAILFQQSNVMMDYDHKWTLQKSFLYSFSVMTTIGYGTITPRSFKSKIATVIYAALGIPLFIIYVSYFGSTVARHLQGFCHLLCNCCCRRKDKNATNNHNQLYRVTNDETIEYETPKAIIDEASNFDIIPKVHGTKTTEPLKKNRPYCGPIFLGLLMLAGHIAGGTHVITLWEGWSYFDAFYFIFISLSTIGFGDLILSEMAPNHGVVFFAYLLTGYTLIGACFVLLYEAALKKCHVIGIKIGIVEE